MSYRSESYKKDRNSIPSSNSSLNVGSPQGEVVYKHLQMSQGVYFVIKGIAEAYVKLTAKEQEDNEEKIQGIVAQGELFGYTRCNFLTPHEVAPCVRPSMRQRSFEQAS